MLKERVETSIRKIYPGADTHGLVEKGGRVTGFVVDDGFRGKGPIARTREVWEQIRRDMKSETSSVGFLVFLTPEEAA